jgi:hypothetical protein
MQNKVAYRIFVVLLIFLFSCSTAKKGTTTVTNINTYDSEYKVLEMSKERNLLEYGFVIKNAKVSIDNKSFSGNIGLYAKVNSDGDFMAIGKGPVGIEYFRIYGIGDSVWVVDRINKAIYEGKTEKVFEKYGLPADFWRMVIGDVPQSAILNTEEKKKSTIEIEAYCSDTIYDRDLKISRSSMKASDITLTSNETHDEISFRYENFKESGAFIFPGKVTINCSNPVFHVEMNIENFECQVNEEIVKKLPDFRSIAL